MGPPGGGRNDITGRLTRHMNVICMDETDETMVKIFSTITDWHFAKGFDPSFGRVGKMVVQATMDIYKLAILKFLPTPAKSHYVFNLHDFARMIRGVLLVPNTVLKNEKKLQRLWVHELFRVFYDRMTDDADRWVKLWQCLRLMIEFYLNLIRVVRANVATATGNCFPI
jgi:dynein heavy chain